MRVKVAVPPEVDPPGFNTQEMATGLGETLSGVAAVSVKAMFTFCEASGVAPTLNWIDAAKVAAPLE